MEQISRRKSDLLYDKPKQNGNILPERCCAAFTPRKDAALTQCWYCKYADFHLGTAQPLEVGVCRWPREKTGAEKGEEI